MSDSANLAVFLSYASQDAAAAKKICDALRAVGIEVWFDQNELVGGDQWDQKIRGQVKACALFVPIISAATQARLEGYFRLEWKLAASRTHTMADAKPFLLPVVIDATRDADAHVPEEFRVVQWTRLPGGETPEKFCERVKRLLGGESSTGIPSAGSGQALPVTSGHAQDARATPRRSPWLASAILGGAAIVALAIWQPWKNSAPASATIATPSPVAAKPAAPLTEARQLTLKARALIDDDLMAGRENFRLAEEFCQKAVGLDNTDAEAWATWARVSGEMIRRAYDTTPQRRESARGQAERAMRLAPDSIEAGLAMADHLRVTGELADSERRLRELLGRAPMDSRVALALAEVLEGRGQDAEASEIRLNHPAFAGKDPRPLVAETNHLRRKDRLVEALALIDRAQSLAPTPLGYRIKFSLLSFEFGDLEAARLYLEKVPPQLLLEDALASRVAQVWLRLGQGDKALEVLRRVPRDFFEENLQVLPKGYLTGWALRMTGRPAAAEAEWKQALTVVEKRLAPEPNQPALLRWKALLLALTGQKEEADRAQKLGGELSGQTIATSGLAEFLLAQGRQEETVGALQAAQAASIAAGRRNAILAISLRDHPCFERVRKDPRVQQIITEGEVWLKELRRATANPSGGNSAAVPTPDDKSVAVLAFADLSAAHDSEYFSDGISEELINALGKVPGLKVPARTSSFYFKGKSVPIPEIAKQLGVAYLIEGSVQRLGDKVKIGARLSKAADGFQVWTDSFTRDAKDVFAVEEEIAGLIAKQLSLKLGAASNAATASVNPQAFEFYVQARQAWNRRSDAGYTRAEELLNRALAIDANFARAHAALADVWLTRDQTSVANAAVWTFSQRGSSAQGRVVAKIRQALALDANSAEARASLGLACWLGWQPDVAVQELRLAISLNPNYASAHHWLGRVLMADGRIEEGTAEFKLAVELDPFSWAILDNYAWSLLHVGRNGEALSAAERALLMRAGEDSSLISRHKVDALWALGRKEEAVALARSLASQSGRAVSNRILSLADVGLRQEAEALLPLLQEDAWQMGALAAVGRNEEAIATFTESRLTAPALNRFFYDQACDSIRNDPRVMRVLATLGLTEAHARAQAWRKAHPAEKPDAKN